jgi:hypothetical protein
MKVLCIMHVWLTNFNYKSFSGKPRPIVFALMTSRTEQMYLELFRFCRDHLGIIARAGMFDFECQVRKAFQRIYVNAVVFGCYFHYCQAIWRNARKHLGSIVMKSNREVCHTIKMIMRLGLLPVGDVCEGVRVIKRYIKDNAHQDRFRTFIK